MEDELIKYILELVDGEDWICEELHSTPSGEEYCSKIVTIYVQNVLED